MVEVTGQIKQAHYKTIISNGRHESIADEPENNGGTDFGFEPVEILCSSLAACTCITLQMYAERKKWNLTGVKTRVMLTGNDEKNISNIQREIELTGDFSDEQRERLLHVANHCPVHKILRSSIEIETKLS
ncbi:MAG TPA: OsmC family protein [Puia sp.]|nr:OsmC family protein [Puia sp.]